MTDPNADQVNDDMSQTTDENRDPDDEAFGVPDLRVHDNGRIIIPARFRDRHDIEEDDVVDLRITAEGVQFWALDLIVQRSGRITIPSRKRSLYGVGDGDIIDIDVLLTEMAADGA
jgi:bifunctional DNA-binding transcriptional regulator/antitoxin component of YhaV-PrlF toxin-antitoxin module